ncbi:hypothetical protein [Mycolicibacter icosiumassiliensis]|uniref:hypothetical protein n=1 Tax=Mycolicibacter icosiumassiliensis TaxID=1792835 RepID=UPI000AFA7F87|nr:hypothetical protein [Mycolicibacter icosiumassiliensis]
MGGEIAPTADTVVELVRQQAARFGEKIAFLGEQRAVVDVFLAASQAGDFEALGERSP